MKTLPKVFAKANITGLNSQVWLRDLSFLRGKTYLVEAASGMGKSSLCSFIYGIRKDYEGDIFFDNKNLEDISNGEWNKIRQHSLSMMFQELSLFEELTGFENVELKNRLTHHKTREEIEHWFDMLGIKDKLDKKAGKISFGQRQRVALIRALCQPFDFLILDEPVSHLDEKNGEIFTGIMLEEVKKQDAGLIVTSIGKHPKLNYDEVIRL